MNEEIKSRVGVTTATLPAEVPADGLMMCPRTKQRQRVLKARKQKACCGDKYLIYWFCEACNREHRKRIK